MNPAYNKTLNLLVEIIGRHHTTPRPTSQQTKQTQTYRRPPTKKSKRIDFEAEDVKKKMFGGANPSYSVSTKPQKEPSEDPPPKMIIPPPLKRQDPKKKPFFNKMLGVFKRIFGRDES